eukprot:7645770-Pyramimonas_sp.AAC.1
MAHRIQEGTAWRPLRHCIAEGSDPPPSAHWTTPKGPRPPGGLGLAAMSAQRGELSGFVKSLPR